MKVMAGEVPIVDESIYPVAPATIQPTRRPMMIETFFIKGDPNTSVRRIEMNERNPIPMNSADPHLGNELVHS